MLTSLMSHKNWNIFINKLMAQLVLPCLYEINFFLSNCLFQCMDGGVH